LLLPRLLLLGSNGLLLFLLALGFFITPLLLESLLLLESASTSTKLVCLGGTVVH
jgi:hypothetical protein